MNAIVIASFYSKIGPRGELIELWEEGNVPSACSRHFFHDMVTFIRRRNRLNAGNMLNRIQRSKEKYCTLIRSCFVIYPNMRNAIREVSCKLLNIFMPGKRKAKMKSVQKKFILPTLRKSETSGLGSETYVGTNKTFQLFKFLSQTYPDSLWGCNLRSSGQRGNFH